MDTHIRGLQKVCRLCCGLLKDARTYAKDAVRVAIARSLGVDVTEDDPQVHPSSLCGACYRKLTHWKTTTTKKRKVTAINIAVHDFTPHQEECSVCAICKPSAPQDTLALVQEAAKDFPTLQTVVRANRVLLVELDDNGNSKKVIIIKMGGMWSCRVYGQLVSSELKELNHIPKQLTCDTELIKQLINAVNTLHICPGNPEYQEISDEKLTNMPVYRHIFPDHSTVRHDSCPLLTSDQRCGPCRIYRSTLASSVSKSTASSSTSQHVPYKHLSKESLQQRLNTATKTVQTMKRKIEKLETRISKLVEKEGVELPEEQEEIFRGVLKQEATFVDSLPEGSPQKVMWAQQAKAATTSPRGMRWHPSVLRMCIALHAKSTAAYSVLRKSGFLRLPHESTLFNYTHFTDVKPGNNPDLLQHIMKENQVQELPSFKRNICVLMDEMKLKSGLFFTSSGKLVGFSDLGPVNNERQKFEQGLRSQEAKLASHVFVLMARGLFSGMKFPFAYYPCEGMTSEQLYACVWGGIQVLECWGLKVRAVTSDGASNNRTFYNLCANDGDGHWTLNPYDTGRRVYFFSDPPHLVKTFRNNLANSGSHTKTRNLMFREKHISWRHILNVHEWDVQSGSGLRMLYKITNDHMNLTPTSRMRVSLAAQVLSSTMANALQAQASPDTESTQYCIRMVDLFFDCLNVSNLHDGKKKRKIALEPYTSPDDWRFTFLEEDFLGFLEEWESEGMTVPGLSKTERGKLCLSLPTLRGLRMTVRSFVALARELLQEEGVEYLLSEKFSQDPLEEHFSKQRGMGGTHDNPDAKQFGSNMLVLQVAGSCIASSSRANVKSQSIDTHQDHSLPKRQKKK